MFDIGDAKAFNGILQANLQIVRDLKRPPENFVSTHQTLIALNSSQPSVLTSHSSTAKAMSRYS